MKPFNEILEELDDKYDDLYNRVKSLYDAGYFSNDEVEVALIDIMLAIDNARKKTFKNIKEPENEKDTNNKPADD